MRVKRLVILGLLSLVFAGCGNFTDPFSPETSEKVFSGSNENGSGSNENGSGSNENG